MILANTIVLIKKNELLVHKTLWMNLQEIILCEKKKPNPKWLHTVGSHLCNILEIRKWEKKIETENRLWLPGEQI